MALDVKKIKQDDLAADQYFPEDCSALKKQIVLHHTAGGASPVNVVYGWQFNTERVGTAFVIGGKPSNNDTHKDGEIFQAFGSKYYAWHLAFSKSTNKVPAIYHSSIKETEIAKASIGIEICNWGQLVEDAKGNFRNYVNGIIPPDDVVKLATPFRGFLYYHKYSDAQLASVKDLVIYLCDKYNIPKTYNADMFDISVKALDGTAGIWSHVSYRSDKNDCSMQPNLIKTLQEIAG